jgi:hypothetical protein
MVDSAASTTAKKREWRTALRRLTALAQERKDKDNAETLSSLRFAERKRLVSVKNERDSYKAL